MLHMIYIFSVFNIEFDSTWRLDRMIKRGDGEHSLKYQLIDPATEEEIF